MRPSILVAVIGLIAAHQAAARDALEADAMLKGVGDPRFLDNAAFVPPADAGPARLEFVGTLDFSEAPIRTDPETMEARLVLGRETTRFPGFEIGLFSHESDLDPYPNGRINVLQMNGSKNAHFASDIRPRTISSTRSAIAVQREPRSRRTAKGFRQHGPERAAPLLHVASICVSSDADRSKILSAMT